MVKSSQMLRATGIFFVTGLGFSHITILAELDKRQYTTRQEKRESGHRYDLFSGLTVAAIAEMEHVTQRPESVNQPRRKEDDFSKSLDIDFLFQPVEFIKAELVFEFDDDSDKIIIDEAVVSVELNKIEIESGKLYLPFGEYFSHFVDGAIVEFAEIRVNGVIVSYAMNDNINFSLFAYEGKTQKKNTLNSPIDGGVSAEIQPFDSFLFGLSYVSYIAEAEEIQLDDTNNTYIKRVDGAGAYIAYEFADFRMTGEYLTALRTFEEFDADRDKPSAWNIEATYFSTEKIEWSLRLSASKELEDEAEQQIGIAGSWHINSRVSVTLDYLRNKYKPGFVLDEDDNALNSSKQISARLSFRF